MPIRSMTGFARVRREADGVEFTVSLKSVNHRGLDLHFHTGAEIDPLENDLRNLIKRYVQRGHLDIRVLISHGGVEGHFVVDHGRLRGFVTAYRQAAIEHGIVGEPDLNAAFRIPGVIDEGSTMELTAGRQQVLLEAFEQALKDLNCFREREGSEMAAVVNLRNEAILAAAGELGGIRKAATQAFHERLKDRLQELLAGSGMEPQRLAQEAAMLADRSDVGEEIERLGIHARQVGSMIQGGGEAGKRLDFLLQEMNRETNTILSKTTGLGGQGLRITELALAAKADIEKIRELSLNIE